MTQHYTLSRRNALAALGAVGVASAGAGLGTSAFFSDEETFKNNTLTAGSLDLKLDWEEHYSDWSDDEKEAVGEEVFMEDPDDDSYVGLPTAANPLIWVHEDDVSAFMDATAVEAYPDVNDDGIQDSFALEPGETIEVDETEIGYVCEDGADTPEDLDPTTENALRTYDDDTVVVDPETEEESPAPLVNLHDVKPGDFGEITFSLHLCDNPGYIWANGELLQNAENGVTEPEAKDPDEDDGNGIADPNAGDNTSGELADSIRAMLWYDVGTSSEWDGDAGEGDNIGQEGEPVIVQGPLKQVLEVLATDLGIPLGGGTGGGVVPIPGEGGSGEELVDDDCEVVEGNPSCSDYDLLRAIKIGSDDIEAKTYSTPAGDITLSDIQTDDEGEVISIDFTADFEVNTVIVKGGPNAHVCQKTDSDGNVITVTEGDDLTAPENQNTEGPYGISHISFCYDGKPSNGDDGDDNGDRECFENSTTAYVGFAWWLPIDHGNEVQTDSVAFDLGFYTEQCRHNDGSGMIPENETVTNGTTTNNST